MKCIVYINEAWKEQKILEIEEADELFKDNNYPCDLYNEIADAFKDNKWTDICCESIDYLPDHIACEVWVGTDIK